MIEPILTTTHFGDGSEDVIAFLNNKLEFRLNSAKEGDCMISVGKVWNMLNSKVGRGRSASGCRGWILSVISVVDSVNFSAPCLFIGFRWLLRHVRALKGLMISPII
jgi:hypothetical protein